MSISNNQIELFQSLFKGRENVYAKRWEKEDRSGYMPAYDVDWDKYEKHKALGGTFQNFKHKTLAPLTPQVIKNHLLEKETVGIYPALNGLREEGGTCLRIMHGNNRFFGGPRL